MRRISNADIESNESSFNITPTALEAAPRLTHIHVSMASIYGTRSNGAGQDQTSRSMASDLFLHCLLPKQSLKI